MTSPSIVYEKHFESLLVSHTFAIVFNSARQAIWRLDGTSALHPQCVGHKSLELEYVRHYVDWPNYYRPTGLLHLGLLIIDAGKQTVSIQQ